MYGLPGEFDAAVFAGRTLERVSFTTNTLELWFDDDISITVESEVRHDGRDEDGMSWVDSYSVPVRCSRLMCVLGSSIGSAGVERPGTLVLQFANGHTLRCIEDSDQYECYRIRIGPDEIIV